MPGICQTALAAIAELRGDHGIEPTPDEIVRLHELGARVEDPDPGERLALLGCPVKCGNVVLFRITIAAEIWWREFASQWWSGSDLYLTASLGFALAHGRDPGALPMERDKAFLAVRAWFRTLAVTRDQLNAAILESIQDESWDRAEEIRAIALRIIDLTWATNPGVAEAVRPLLANPTPKRTKPPDWDEMVQDLSVATSTNPSVWLHSAREYVIRAWIRARRHELARSGMSAPDNTTDARQTEAIRAFRLEVSRIIASRHKASASAREPSQAPTP